MSTFAQITKAELSSYGLLVRLSECLMASFDKRKVLELMNIATFSDGLGPSNSIQKKMRRKRQ